MQNWKHGDGYGQEVRVAGHLDKRDFTNRDARRPGARGVVIGHSDSHGLCFEVRHTDGSTAWYDPDELSVFTRGNPAPFTSEDINAQAEQFPLRNELTVLPANDAKPTTLGWVVREYNGVPIYPYAPDAEGRLPPQLEPIRTKEGLKEGMQILVASLLGGWHVMTVVRDEDGELCGQGWFLSSLWLSPQG